MLRYNVKQRLRYAKKYEQKKLSLTGPVHNGFEGVII